MRYTYSSVILVLLIVTNVQSTWAQTVRAYVDRNPISIDETVRLIVEEQGQSSGDSPNLSVLERDFDVLGNSQSSQTRIINGRTSTSRQWVITLAPKHDGKVMIPPIAVGGQSSAPLALMVQLPSQAEPGGGGKDFFLEATVEPNDPYVQSQILYTLRLYHAVPLREGQIEDPIISNAMVERIGEDHTFETIQHGRRYQVVERRYLIVPQASGSLKIPSVLFSGQVPDDRRPRSLFDDMFGNRPSILGSAFQSTRLVRARSPELTLEVQEVPPDKKSDTWLPARELSLSETWSIDSLEVQIGDPITRTITIQAKGLTGEQLPELSLSENANMKIYPDQPTITTNFDGAWAVGTREQKLALVPTQPGNITLPEIRIRWWNIENDRAEDAVLPARELKILGVSSSSSPILKTENVASLKDTKSPPGNVVGDSADSQNGADDFSSSLQTQWPILAGLFLVLWFLTLLGWWYDRRKIRSNVHMSRKQGAEQKRQTLRAVRESVKKACLKNSPHQTREALLKWASVAWQGSQHRNLGSVARKFTAHENNQSDAQQAICDLDRKLYAEQRDEWDGKRFWDIVSQEMKTIEGVKAATSRKDNESLPSLYLHAK